MADKTGDPANARDNVLERDWMFTEPLHEEATSLELRTVEADTAIAEKNLTDRVAGALGL